MASARTLFPSFSSNRRLLACPVVGVAIGATAAPWFARVLPPPEPSMGRSIAAPRLRDEALRCGQRLSGSPSSKFLVVEVSDYLCPACRKAEESLPGKLDAMPDVGRVLVHCPFHAGARETALTSLEADRLGLGPSCHRLLMRFPMQAWPTMLTSFLKSKALTTERMDASVAQAQSRLAADARIVSDLGLKWTPTFIVCGPDGSVFQAYGASGLLRYLQSQGA